jgi:hypothetical protein
MRIIFNTYAEGSGFLAETPSATVFLLGHIRSGRSAEIKHKMMKQLNDAAVTIGGISSDSLAIVLQEISPGHGMEFGMIVPGTSPEEEARWLAARAQ